MTTYKAIHGKLVQHLASDPDAAAYEGQLWFNTTSSDYKTILKADGSWSTGGNLNTARYGVGSAGTQTAGLGFGGDTPTPSVVGIAEEYDGSSWTESGDLNTARYGLGGAGTSAAAVAFGGYTGTATGATEEWSSTSTTIKTIDTD